MGRELEELKEEEVGKVGTKEELARLDWDYDKELVWTVRLVS